MHHRLVVSQRQIKAPPYRRGVSKAAAVVELVYALENELDILPKLYVLEHEHTLWVNFENSCLECEWFFEEYSAITAFISAQYPATALGTVRGQESAEIEIRGCEQDSMLQITKSNISGKDFSTFTDLCLRILIENPAEMSEMYALLSNLSAHQTYLAVHRCPLTKEWFANYPDVDPYTCYQYIPLLGDDCGKESFWEDITVEQRKYLWLQLLCEHSSMLEFEYVIEALCGGYLTDFFKWELALRQALDEENVEISFSNEEFRMTDKNGKRLLFSYVKGSGAEKLFLKIIFPVTPGHK